MVRKRFGWLASLATAIFLGLLAAGVARAQPPGNGYYEVPPPPGNFPSPLGHPRYENGGFYFGGGFKFMQMTNPMKQQIIAYRGFFDRDGSIGDALGLPNSTPGQFIGDVRPALGTEQLAGPLTFVPGMDVTIGYRMESGICVELNWFRLADARYSATAGPQLSPFDNPGLALENTFISSPVYNYSLDFVGPAVQLATFPGPVPLGNAGATSGIWNASSLMTIDFVQRFDQWQINVRYPLQQTDDYRLYGLFGTRLTWFWERFHWRTVATDANGLAGPQDQANYSNVVSNRMYGTHCGLGNEWYLGTTPIGAFSVSLDLEAALFANFVSTKAAYVLGDNSTGASRKRGFFTMVPEVQASLNLLWFPYEAITVNLGYDAMAFFNTVSAPRPVDFNVGAIDPGWERNTMRFMHGLSFKVGVVF